MFMVQLVKTVMEEDPPHPPKPLLLLIFSTKAALRSPRICSMGSHCSLTTNLLLLSSFTLCSRRSQTLGARAAEGKIAICKIFGDCLDVTGKDKQQQAEVPQRCQRRGQRRENSSDLNGREREKKETSLVSVRGYENVPGPAAPSAWFVEVEAGMCSDRLMEKPHAGSADPRAFLPF